MADSEPSSVAAPLRAPPPAALRGRSYSAVEASAAPHQAPQPAKTTAAALRGHLTRVADAVLLVYCVASWANLAANGVAIAARWACGDGDASRAVAAARKITDAAFVVMVVLIPVAAPRFIWIVEKWRKTGDRQVGSGVTRRGDVQRDRPASSGPGARPCQNAGPASVTVAMLVVLVCIPVMLVGLLIQGHAPAKGSNQDKFGAAISDMASLIAVLVLCSFLLPGFIIQLLRHGSELGFSRWQLNA